MGLDAGVFRNVTTMQKMLPGCEFNVDSHTGQAVAMRNDLELPLSLDDYLAADFRIGNISHVGYLRELFSSMLAPDSFIQKRVIYSGSHCGDIIELQELDELRKDIEAINKHREVTIEWQISEFLDAMVALVAAAAKERNPIVFI